MAPGYEAKDKATGAPLVMKLLKTLNGLNQSPKNWHGTIDAFIVGIAFNALKSDPCVHIFNGTTTMKQGLSTDDDSTVILTLYVDDVLLEGGSKATLEMIKGKLMSRSKMSDMGDVSRVLGMQLTRLVKQDRSPSTRRTTPGDCLSSTACKTTGRWGRRGTARSCSWCNRKGAFWTTRQSGVFKRLMATPCTLVR